MDTRSYHTRHTGCAPRAPRCVAVASCATFVAATKPSGSTPREKRAAAASISRSGVRRPARPAPRPAAGGRRRRRGPPPKHDRGHRHGRDRRPNGDQRPLRVGRDDVTGRQARDLADDRPGLDDVIELHVALRDHAETFRGGSAVRTVHSECLAARPPASAAATPRGRGPCEPGGGAGGPPRTRKSASSCHLSGVQRLARSAMSASSMKTVEPGTVNVETIGLLPRGRWLRGLRPHAERVRSARAALAEDAPARRAPEPDARGPPTAGRPRPEPGVVSPREARRGRLAAPR